MFHEIKLSPQLASHFEIKSPLKNPPFPLRYSDYSDISLLSGVDNHCPGKGGDFTPAPYSLLSLLSCFCLLLNRKTREKTKQQNKKENKTRSNGNLAQDYLCHAKEFLYSVKDKLYPRFNALI